MSSPQCQHPNPWHHQQRRDPSLEAPLHFQNHHRRLPSAHWSHRHTTTSLTQPYYLLTQRSQHAPLRAAAPSHHYHFLPLETIRFDGKGSINSRPSPRSIRAVGRTHAQILQHIQQRAILGVHLRAPAKVVQQVIV
jgi:hypothetical protein